MTDYPVEDTRGLVFLADGALAFAGPYLHQDRHPDHTHSFVEIALIVGGTGVHRSMTGRRPLATGDVILLRPGVWHGYESCDGLRLYNCGFSTDLLHRELAWTREEPLLGHLLWTGPYASQRRGILTGRLPDPALAEAANHLDALGRGPDHGDVIGRLILFLTVLSRAMPGPPPGTSATHPAVTQAIRLLETDPARSWNLADLAGRLRLSPGYLVRIFKATTGLPPVAYLSRHRVEAAAHLLLHTTDPITQIAQSVGWPDQNYFARRFRAHYGLSASTYRRRFTDAAHGVTGGHRARG
ncbi:AraC family transcriptional regulator [Actinoplanes rectilineatus]|uniref:AraC family transcriptional regulator n=1 Tax=Actinoplanes rectilineatus TaxID=113571 RepID=UPI0005F2B01D|nr:AraC family transcriptional regulator [Actinoplanes rectilineatus]